MPPHPMQPPHMAPHAAPHPAPAGGIATMLQALAQRHAAAGPVGAAPRPAGGPMPLTQRGNPVSPYGHEPAAGPVPQQPQRPLMMG